MTRVRPIWTLLLGLWLAGMLAGCGGGSDKATPGASFTPSTVPSLPPLTGSALILHDTAGDYGWAGVLYAVQLQNLLTHMGVEAELKPVEQYLAGDLDQADCLFYIGISYDNPLPAALFEDILGADTPVCWIGYNLWQFAQDHADDLATQYGFSFQRIDTAAATAITVQYKGRTLQMDPTDPDLSVIRIDNAALCTAVATATKNSSTFPYIARAGNFWFVAGNPFLLVGYNDKYLAFADCLHDIVGVNHAEKQYAYLRIEDVSPASDPEQLKRIADFLWQRRIPYGVCVIPEYRDPLLAYGEEAVVTMDDSPEVVAALQYMQSRGGHIIQHGYTHQYGVVKNPYSGTSAEDFEFFRVQSTGTEYVYAPIPEDSYAWANDRVTLGKTLLTAKSLTPVGWNTPHYLASEVDYSVFADHFTYNVDAGMYFTTIAGAPPTEAMLRRTRSTRAGEVGTQYFIQQLAPYPLRDIYGIIRVPETMGYVDPFGFDGEPPSLPADLLQRALGNQVVRDGWSSCFFHWFLDLSYLEELVNGLEQQGVTFVAVPK